MPYLCRSRGGWTIMRPYLPKAIETPLRATAVRLIERHGDVPSGTVGHIVGRFARENPTFLVSFQVEGVIEVRADEIVSDAA